MKPDQKTVIVSGPPPACQPVLLQYHRGAVQAGLRAPGPGGHRGYRHPGSTPSVPSPSRNS